PSLMKDIISSTSNKLFKNQDLDYESFRKLGYEVIDSIADYYTTIRDREIISRSSSKDIEAVFNDNLPIDGDDPQTIINDWENRILPHATHIGSPRYFGFVNGSGTMMSVFASALAASVNMNAGSWKAGPAAIEIERKCIAWMAELIGYTTNCGGLFVGGGTIANQAALTAALHNHPMYDRENGLQTNDQTGTFTLYMSDHEGHISIVKAATMIGLGRNCIRRVPGHDDLTMNVDALREMVEKDISAGNIPFCVVAQVGSINIGAIDPLEHIAQLCKEKNIWFHADGACGAVGAMLPELSEKYKGLEQADSVTLDPHKWLYISYECGCLLVKDPAKLKRTFSTAASYLQNSLPTDYKGLDYFDYGPQMSRGFIALKFWMTLRHWGKKGYQQLLRQNIECAKHMHQLVLSSVDFLPMHLPQLFIYSFRFFPADVREEHGEALQQYLDLLNQKIADEITASGFAFIMTSKVKDKIVLRLSICSHRTTLDDIEQVFNRLHLIGIKLHREKKT
ncbi:MAG TPA: pyridoxal-dependent decarboxylase, partial [Flavisolibacter sp.]|nr:pyridoxal-dependent decarboxylase [Flavisolibacter sp.]